MINTPEIGKVGKKSIRRLLEMLLSAFRNCNDLRILGFVYGTDKFSHGYLEYYQKILDPIRFQKLNVLEIGVGGYSDPKAGGESLRMWQNYFPNSMIYAVDTYDKHYLQDKRIKIFKGSQNNPAFLRHVAAEIGSLDIIVDDGSHINEHVTTSFHTLFPFLRNGGIYIIEDIFTSYLREYGGNSDDLNDRGTTISMVKGLIDGLHYRHIANREPTYFDRNVSSILIHPNVVIIFKDCNR